MALDPSKISKDISATNDLWQEAIRFFTGYDAPKRNTLFGSLVGNEGIPLMKVEISDMGTVDYVDPDDLNWLSENAGYKINNTDFVIPFYHASGGAGSEVSYHKARITLLGDHTEKDGKLTGGVIEGGQFSSHIDGHLGMDGKPTWDTGPLNQYSYGTGRALEALLWNKLGTHGFAFGGLPVDNANSVTLANFDHVAGAFDRAAKFFIEQKKQVEDWQTKVGTQKNEAWRGQAAGVFWDLIHKIKKQYTDYAEDMSPAGTYASKQGNEIREAKKALEKAAGDLQRVWAAWEWKDGNPLVHLHKVLSAMTKYVWDNNITKITYDVEVYGESVYTTYEAEAGFSNSAKVASGYDLPADVASKDFGDLKELSTWANIGNQALLLWQQSIEEKLEPAAVDALKYVKENWSTTNFDLGEVKSRGGGTLKEDLQEEKADLAEEKANKAAEDAAKAAAEAARKQEEFMQWQKEQALKAEELRKREKAEAERKEAEAKAEAERKEKEAKAEAERKEKEAEAKAAEQEAKQEQKEAEAKAEQERKEKEAEAKAAEAEAKAEQKQAEQEAKQEQKEKEAEAKQAEQEAKQEQKEKEAEQKQAEAQARQEQLQIAAMNQAKAEQERQRKEQEQKEAEAEAKAEQKEAEQEQKQAEAEAKAEAKQAEQEAKQEQKEAEAKAEQEQKEKEAEAKAAEQEKKAERIRTEQEAKQEEQEAEQEQKQAQAEAKADQIRAEQEAKQEQKEQEAEAKQSELQAKQEQKQAEQEQKQAEAEAKADRIRSEQEQKQSEAEAAFNNERRSILNNGDLSQLAPTDISGPVNDGLDLPGGGETRIDANGRVTTDFPDGSSTTIDPLTHTSTVTRPDGTTISGPLNSGDLLTNPDGSATRLDSEGNVVTQFPDGTVQTVDPDTGNTTVNHPDGTTTSGHLNGSLNLPSANAPSYSWDSSAYGGYEEELYDGSPYRSPLDPSPSTAPQQSPTRQLLNAGAFPGLGTSGSEVPGLGSSAGGAGGGGAPMGGMPMGGGMGGMGGMGGGMGAGGGSGDNGERVRNVFDGDVVSNRRPRSGASPVRQGYADDEVRVAASGPTTGSSPFLPPMAGGGAPGQTPTQSGDRARDAWVAEDEDVWGTDEGGAPAVIGR